MKLPVRATPTTPSLYDGRLVSGTPEQEAIWAELLEGQHHVLVEAVAGCLTGDTIVGVNRGGISRAYRLADVVHKFNGKERRSHHDRPWDLTIPTRIRSVRDNTVVLEELICAVSSGHKKVYEVTTASGKRVQATDSHVFLTDNGWAPLSDIDEGDRLFADAGKGGNKLAPKPAYQRMTGMGAHPYHHKSKPHCCVWTHRLVVEADLNGISLDEFIWLIRQCRVEDLKFLDPQEHYVHHADENTFNNARANLEVIVPKEHARHHARNGAWDHVQAHVNFDRIISISTVGVEQTYDLTMNSVSGQEPNFLANGLVVHNSGKTFTIVQYAMREKTAKIGLVAFNKHIAAELKSRVGDSQRNVEAMTYHSLGYRACKQALGRCELDTSKVWGILDRISLSVSKDKEKIVAGRIKALVSLAKQYGVIERADLELIADKHGMDFNGEAEAVLDMTPKVLEKCRVMTKTVDFDDMVWLPFVLGLDVPKYDVLCVDEYQDTGLTQQSLALKAGRRIVAVGDPKQAIYQFRGADTRSFQRLRDTLGEDLTVTLPLTLTRRCPKSHVRMAQRLVPQIQALETAPEGVIRQVTSEEALAEMRPGDLVLCRVNAELIGVAYRLLKRGVKAVVRGRDIGTGLTQFLEKAEKEADSHDLGDVMKAAMELTMSQRDKLHRLPHGRGEGRMQQIQDRYDCLQELAMESKSVDELKRTIAVLFADFDESGAPKNAVVLGTVHRTKGLEACRVYVLRPDLIPHPMAKKKEDQEQEMNLGYVAVTRAKFSEDGTQQGELIFVGGACSLFPLTETKTIEVSSEGTPMPYPSFDYTTPKGLSFTEALKHGSGGPDDGKA